MAVLLSAVDPWGRAIKVTEEQWRRHVPPDHQELIDLEGAVAATLTAPTDVAYDADDGRRDSFYRLGVLPPPYDRLFLKVCVEFALSTVSSAPRGFVVTAYPTQRIKQPEVLKWP